MVPLPPPALQTPTALLEVRGQSPGERLGAAVGVIADLDGDGVAEWLAARGGETADQSRPELLVLSGASGAELFRLAGNGPINTLFLQAVLDVGDVDGDGVSDLAFGNSTARVDGMPNRGRVTVFSGASGTRLYSTEGPVSSGAFGGALARLGDLDGDGVDDVVVGQIGTQDENAWLLSGTSGALLGHVPGPHVGDPEFGWSVASAGDVDADGLPDFAVGTLRAGTVTVFSGTGRRLLVLQGSRSFGRRIVDMGDLDGDAFHELAIAESSRGTVWLAGMRGGAPVPIAIGGPVQSLARAGDLDGDGRADLLVGDELALDETGMVQLFSTGTGRPLARLIGAHPGDRFGSSLAGAVDLDGDGRPEVVVGAPGSDGPGRGTDTGSASVWSLVRTARTAPR